MTNEIELGDVAPLIEMLVAESDAIVRDRILFEAVWAAGVSTSLALWREWTDPADSSGPRWVRSYERGPTRELPDRVEIEELSRARLEMEVLPSRRTWFAGEHGSRCVLVLRGVTGTEDALDRLEALHTFAACLSVETREHELPPDSLVRRAPHTTGAAGELARLEHDLRNVVASIRATQDLLEDLGATVAETERERMERTLDREWRRAGEMLLCGARAPAGHACASSRPADVVRQVAASERAAFRQQGLELALDIEPAAESLCVAVPEAELHRMLQNLLANARQALAGGRRNAASGEPDVRIRAARREHGGVCIAELVVEDRGPGLPPLDPERLFDSGVSIGPHGGSGLGLAVVREIVERARGSIRAENRARGGARFTVMLAANSV